MNWPLVRYKYKSCYIMSYREARPPRASVLVVEDKERVNDFFLGMGFREVASFSATTWRKAYNQAKSWADNHQDFLMQNRATAAQEE